MALSIAFGIIAAGIAYELVRVGIVLKLRYVIGSKWFSAPGKLEKYELVSPLGSTTSGSEAKRGVPYQKVVAVVSYSVGDEIFTTELVTPWDIGGGANNYAPSLRRYFEYVIAQNSRLDVLYRPANPKMAVISPNVGSRIVYDLVACAMAIAATAVVYAFYVNMVRAISPDELLWGTAIGVLIGALIGAAKAFRVAAFLARS